jgi:hypothetical protein
LAGAARRVGRDPGTVRRWQRADEERGNGWRLCEPRSVATKSHCRARSREDRAAVIVPLLEAGRARSRREPDFEAANRMMDESTRLDQEAQEVWREVNRAVEEGDAATAARLSGVACRLTVQSKRLFERHRRPLRRRERCVPGRWQPGGGAGCGPAGRQLARH